MVQKINKKESSRNKLLSVSKEERQKCLALNASSDERLEQVWDQKLVKRSVGIGLNKKLFRSTEQLDQPKVPKGYIPLIANNYKVQDYVLKYTGPKNTLVSGTKQKTKGIGAVNIKDGPLGPNWQYTRWNMPSTSAPSRERIDVLSKPKLVHKDYQAPKDVISPIPNPNVKYVVSERIAELARPFYKSDRMVGRSVPKEAKGDAPNVHPDRRHLKFNQYQQPHQGTSGTQARRNNSEQKVPKKGPAGDRWDNSNRVYCMV